jgi:UDP-glucose 4-epimerase
VKALVLGGAGFIGKNLVKELALDCDDILVVDSFVNSDKNHFSQMFAEVELIDEDITKGNFLRNLVSNFNPTHIFHLAANSDIKEASFNPSIDIKNTFLTTVKILESIPPSLRPVFFFASSSAVYGAQKGRICENSELHPISSYGWMKYMSEVLLNEKADSGLISKLIIFRFPNVVGQHMTHGVIFDLINKLGSNPDTLNVLGDGTQEKPYIFGSKLAKLIKDSSVGQGFKSGTYNVSPNDRCTVSEIVEMVLSITELSPKIVYGTTREGWKGDVPEYELDTSKIHAEIPDLSLHSSKSAVMEAIRAYLHESSF